MSGKTAQNTVGKRPEALLGVSPEAKNAAPPAAQEGPKAPTLVPNAKSPALALTRTVERFALQGVARSILPKSRTAKCLRIKAFGQDIGVWKSKEFQTAAYAGLQTCGSVWACPVCAAKVAERRRIELVHAVESHRLNGGFVWMLTLTSPHGRGDVLRDLLASQGRALSSFFADNSVKKVLAEMGMIGKIRALEVTHGRKRGSANHGWHPHFHILQFCRHGATPEQLLDWEDRLYERWAAYCEMRGLGVPSREHGIQIQDGNKAAKYASKWGLEDEMTKAHIKKSRGGESPFDLLRAVMADPKDLQARALFDEYAKQFKGKRQLVWSRGLKKMFAVVEVKDEELANAKLDRADLLGLIATHEWKDVLKAQARATILELATLGGWRDVKDFLLVIDGIHREEGRSPETMQMVFDARKFLLERIAGVLTKQEARKIMRKQIRLNIKSALRCSSACLRKFPFQRGTVASELFGKIGPILLNGSAETPTQVGVRARPLQLGSGTDPRGISATPKLGAA